MLKKSLILTALFLSGLASANSCFTELCSKAYKGTTTCRASKMIDLETPLNCFERAMKLATKESQYPNDFIRWQFNDGWIDDSDGSVTSSTRKCHFENENEVEVVLGRLLYFDDCSTFNHYYPYFR